MPSETPGDDDLLNRFEAEWKRDRPPNLIDYLPRPDSAHAMEIALRLFERDLYYRVQAGEEAPIAERYFQIPGISLQEEQKEALRSQEESWRQTLSQAIADQFQDIPGHELLTEPGSGPQQGKFDVESLPILGYGGMGVVYRLKDAALNRDVAIKIIRSDLFPNGRDRFENEAQILAQLEHPGVVPIHSIGCYHDGRPFFTMKVVQGKTLEKLLESRKFPGEELSRYIDIFEQVCQTVGFAHSKQILHRDLKPGNVMVGAFGEVQVMDWGLGKLLDAEIPLTDATAEPNVGSGNKTIPGKMIGTYAYAAPEQVKGQLALISQRSDVFGLGAILCEILTGSPPYTSPNLRKKAEEADLSEAWARLSSCGADAELVEIVRGCLAKERETRLADAGEVARRLAEYRAAVQKRLEVARLETEKATARLAAEQKALDAEKQRSRIARWTMGLGLTLAGVAILAALIINNISKENEANIRRAARLAFGQGQVHCEMGDVPRGLFWFVRSMELAPYDTDLQFAARHQLSIWQSQIPTLESMWTVPDKVIAAAFHPAAKTVLLKCESEGDGEGEDDSKSVAIRCCELPSGKELWSLDNIEDKQEWFFEPTGNSFLIVKKGGEVQVLDTTTGEILHKKEMSGKVLAVAFRKGKLPPLVALRKEGKVHVSDWGEKATPCDSTEGEPVAATFDEMGKHLLIRSMTSLLCWDVSENQTKLKVPDRKMLEDIAKKSKNVGTTLEALGSTLTRLEDQTMRFKDATISPDGQWILAACADHKIQLWNRNLKEWKHVFEKGGGHHENVSKVLFNSEGTLFLSGSHNALKLWKADGTVVTPLEVQRKDTDPFGFFSGNDKAVPTVIYVQGTKLGFQMGRETRNTVDWFSVPFFKEPLALHTNGNPENGNLALVTDKKGTCFLWKLGVTPVPKWLPDLSKVYSVKHADDGSAAEVLFRTGETTEESQHWKLHWDYKKIHLDKKEKIDISINKNNLTILPKKKDTALKGRWHVSGNKSGELELKDTVLDRRFGPIMHGRPIRSVRFHPSTEKHKERKLIIIESDNGELGTYEIPQPMEGKPEAIRLRLEKATGLRMDDAGNLNELQPRDWAAIPAPDR